MSRPETVARGPYTPRDPARDRREPGRSIFHRRTLPTNIPMRRLGLTDLWITTVGMGVWGFDQSSVARQAPRHRAEEALAALRYGLELGINWIDTSSAYHHGRSETLVGRFLADLPESARPYVFTKGGLVWDTPDALQGDAAVLQPSVIRSQCERSLRRLRVERLDVYQFHWPDGTRAALEESWAEMTRLIDEGKVRYGGVCGFSPSQVRRATDRSSPTPLAVVHDEFSLERRSAAATLIPWCIEHGLGFIAWGSPSPGSAGSLDAGPLAGTPLDTTNLRLRLLTEDHIGRDLMLGSALRGIAREHGVSITSVAIGWVLAWPGVTAAVGPVHELRAVDEWVRGGALHLTEDDLSAISDIVRLVDAGGVSPIDPRIPARIVARPEL
jgi:aryl-alcohol dehydrogenase-like predicted oxidoreductase